MQTTDLRWDDLRVVLAVVRAGSLKRAAAALGVNVSTVARRLDGLERALGVHLFDRSSDGTRPTEAAERIVPYAETMEQAVLGMARTLEGRERLPEGLVRLTAPPGIAEHLLTRSLGGLLRRYPGLRIELAASVEYADLTRGEADLALRVRRPTAGDLVAVRIGTSPMAALAAPALARRLGCLSDTAAAPWLSWGEKLSHLDEGRWIHEHVPDERVVLRSDSMTVLIEAARAGVGVLLAPRVFAHRPGLIAVPLAPRLRRSLARVPTGVLWLVGHRALRHVPRIAVVWAWLRSTFAAVAGSPAADEPDERGTRALGRRGRSSDDQREDGRDR